MLPARMRPALAFALAAALAACARHPATHPAAATPLARRRAARYAAPPSGAGDLVRSLSDEVGPRLAGSPGDARAVAWALRTMRALGLAHVRAEPVRVPHWERGAERGEIVAPYPHAVALAALGGSVGTPPDGVEAEVVEVGSLDALAALADERVRGRIVYVHGVMARTPTGQGYGDAVPVRVRAAVAAARKGAVAVIIRSVGTDRSRAPHTGAMRYDDAVLRIPAAALSTADADILHRVVAASPAGSVRFRLTLGCRTLPDADSANVVGEVVGTEGAREVVLLGAHLDSWDLGTGALDDGAGVAIVLTTARNVMAAGAPRRTVRVVLFANEENGVAGALAYAAAHRDELAQHIVALEADAGDGRVGVARYAGAPEGRARFHAVAETLAPMGVRERDEPAHGGADLAPMGSAGVPRVDLGQDMSTYFDHHHTANDTPAVLDERALDQAVAVWTAAVRGFAAMDGDFGRAPVEAH
jgi:carboxypeptidase Q